MLGLLEGENQRWQLPNPQMGKQNPGWDKTGLSLGMLETDREFSNQQEKAALRQIPGNTTGEESIGEA